MTQYPLKELKRKLEDEEISLPKRLRLAKNIVNSQHFPTAPKERVVGEWLGGLINSNKITSRELRDILSWTSQADSLTVELRCKLIKVVSQYIHNVPLKDEDIQFIVSFIENSKISVQLITHIDDFFFITVNLLQHLLNQNTCCCCTPVHTCAKIWVQKIFSCIIKYYRESKKKLEFIVKFLEGEILETIFQYLHMYHDAVIDLCQNILFPSTKKSIFSSFLSNLIRKDDINELIAERGDNIKSVLKIMSAFFTFPNGRTTKDHTFLYAFIEVFVDCFKMESQLIFAFYIMASNFFNLPQSYMNPAMKMPPVIFENDDEKIKRSLFLIMLEVLLKNDIDINVKLTDTLGEKIAKVEVKKTFMLFLQAVMMGTLKLEGKIDQTSLQIIKAALKLDPSMIEQKMDKILPHIMTAKKSSSRTMNMYTETINSLIETLFKLSRGMDFVTKMIPHLKLCLEGSNVDQFELKQKLNESINKGIDEKKYINKIINGNDILPLECVEVYGRLASELMFRQNKELLTLLQKDLEVNCLLMLEEGFVSPSIITLTEVLSAILSSFMRYSKMADHTVPLNIAEEFWLVFQKFENDCLQKFGECILKLNYNQQLMSAFLQLCLSFSQLKLLNIKYSNTKLYVPEVTYPLAVADVSVILPCLKNKQWTMLASKMQADETVLLWNQLLLIKVMALEITSSNESTLQSIISTKSHLIKELSKLSRVENNYFMKELFTNIDKNQLKSLAKILVNEAANDSEFMEFEIISNKELLQAIVLETAKVLAKRIENVNLVKPIHKYINDISLIGKENNLKSVIDNVKINDEDAVMNYVNILKRQQIQYLDENYQLTAIIVLLMVKKCCQKKYKIAIDNIMQEIFELSPKYPDIYKLFSVEAIFDFKDNIILELLTFTTNMNNMLCIKCIIELAVKKVKTDSEIVKTIVEILLKRHKIKSKDMESFNNSVFQIICITLPLIAKEKRAITTSAFRSILASLQEKLNDAILKSFKNIDFGQFNEPGNTDNTMAYLNAMGAYTLTLLKCCETTKGEEVKSLGCLWSGLEFFINQAIQAIESPSSKTQHIQSSFQLLNVTLRYIKKLESHPVFQERNQLFQRMWTCVKTRLNLILNQGNMDILEEIAVTLKFLAELSSVECFGTFVGDLSNLALLKKPSMILKSEVTESELASRKVMKYLWIQCLKANIIGQKCVALTKLIFRATKDLRFWIQQHYEVEIGIQDGGQDGDDFKVKIDDAICDLIRTDMDVLSEFILAAKKITLDFKFVDAIFELLHLVHYVMGSKRIGLSCEVSWQSFFLLHEGYMGILNSMLLSREELLEDRWPCYVQCYKTVVQCLCERSVAQHTLDREVAHKLAEASHSVEKLTQSICKRKAHVSRISAYAVADICTWIERSPPPKIVRQHLENSITLLIQVSDSTYAMAFLRRALAGSIGQMTMTNMYTMYKRYHKYVGNS